MPTISMPYATGTITAVSGTTTNISGGATSAWIGRCIRMQNGTAQGSIRKIIAVASATSITVDYAWNISPYTQYGFTEALPSSGNTFVISHFLDDIDDGTTLVKDTNNNYFRLVAGQSLNMNGGSFLYDIGKTFEFDSNFVRCDTANGCFRFGDIDASGYVFNGCSIIETSNGTALNNFAVAVSGLTPLAPDMHIYSGNIMVRAIPANSQAAFWRLYRDANQIVRIDGVYIDGQFGGRLMGSRSVAKDWKVYGNQSIIGAFNPKSPFGKIDNIQVVSSLQALYHFWTESLSAEAEGVFGRNITRLLRFQATNANENGMMLELKDNDITSLSSLSALYQNDFGMNAPANTLRFSQFLNVRIPNAAGNNITSNARVVVRDVTNATIVDTTTTTGVIPRQNLKYRDINVLSAGLFTWANAGGTTYAPYEVAFASYGFIPTTLPLPLLTSQDVSLIALVDSNVTLSANNASALSSKFTINSSGNITVTANATLDEMYDYAAVWITQSAANLLVAGMGQFLIKGVGSDLQLTRNVTTNAGVTLSSGVKFKTFTTTATVTNNGTINGSYTDISGTRVTIKTSDNILLTTRILINGVDQGELVEQSSRNIFVNSTSQVRIFAIAYGYKPKIFNIIGNNPSDYIVSLIPETNVDINQDTTIRDTILSAFATGIDGQGLIYLSVDRDLRNYTPAQVLNALHRFMVVSGGIVASAALAQNSVDGFALIDGGFVLKTPGFYGKVADSVLEDTDRGIYVPLYVLVDPIVYQMDPNFREVRKNSSGVVLGVALWTQKEAAIPTYVAREASVIARPTLAQIEASTILAKEATLSAARTAIIAEVDLIPTNPLLTNDSRLNNLDAAISTRSTLTAPQVRTELSTELSRIDTTISSRLPTTSYIAPDNTSITAIKAKTDILVNGPTLAQIEASTILAKETTVNTRASQSSVSAIPTNPLLTNDTRLNNLDATISSRLPTSSYTAPPTLTAIRTDLERTGGMLDLVPTLSEIESSTILAKEATVNTRATQTSVNSIPTNTLLTNDIRLNNLDTTISSRLATSGYVAPDNANITAIKNKTDTLPTLTQIEASTVLAKQSNFTGIATSANITSAQTAIVNEINANETKIDTLQTAITAIKAKTDGISFTGANINAVAQVVSDKTGYSLTTAERSAIAVAVESALLNETDGQAIINAIVQAIGNQNISEVTLVAAIRADIERAGGMLDNVPTLTEINNSTVLAKETTLNNRPTLAQIEASTILAKQSNFTGIATATDITNSQTVITNSIATVPDLVWDESLNGGSHNLAGSAGRRLRQLADTVILKEGVGSNMANINGIGYITLDPTATTQCVYQSIRVGDMTRFIRAFDSVTKIATLDNPWCVITAGNVDYTIFNLRESTFIPDWVAKESTVLQTETDIIAEINANEIKIDSAITKIDTKASQTSVSAIPTNPLLTNDSRLNNLDTTISSRLATSNYVAPDNQKISDIYTKVNTLVNYNDSAIVSTLNTILADTNELQLNQGNWLTATGFATPANITSAQTNIITEINANETKIDGIKAKTDLIPTNPLLTNDSRLNNLDTTISSRSTLTATNVRAELSTELSRIDTTISSRLPTSSYIAPDNVNISAIKTKVDSLNNYDDTSLQSKANAIKAKTDLLSFTGANINAVAQNVLDKTGYSLTTAERSAIATVVEQSILNENDGQAVLNAIVGAIGNQNINQVALVAAIKTELERTGGMLDALPTLSEIESSNVLAKKTDTTNLATSSHVTDIIFEINSNETKLDSIKTTADAIKAKTDTLQNSVITPASIRTELEAEGSKLDKAMKAAQAAEDQTI